MYTVRRSGGTKGTARLPVDSHGRLETHKPFSTMNERRRLAGTGSLKNLTNDAFTGSRLTLRTPLCLLVANVKVLTISQSRTIYLCILSTSCCITKHRRNFSTDLETFYVCAKCHFNWVSSNIMPLSTSHNYTSRQSAYF